MTLLPSLHPPLVVLISLCDFCPFAQVLEYRFHQHAVVPHTASYFAQHLPSLPSFTHSRDWMSFRGSTGGG